MNRLVTILVVAFVCVFTIDPGISRAAKAPSPEVKAPPDSQPRIDMVFCIDCSGSMGPVIETAKQKVWAIVNEVARAKPSPVLRIGLIGYGDSDRTWRIFGLSDDLDEVYKNLVTFRDEGWGTEFVGMAVHRATVDMKWSNGTQVLKVIYVVGNETARQGPPAFDYAKTAPQAIAAGIIVNAIYCGTTEYATATPTWREMARLADGQYMEIAENGGAVIVATPFDKELGELGARLNTTYVAYGPTAGAAAENQAAQDANATRLGTSVAADRAAAKAAPQYSNIRWDLVDASRAKDFDITKVPDEQLPEDMKKMTAEQRKAHVEQQAKARADLQEKIRELAAKRDAFVKEESEKKGLKGVGAFDVAVRESVVKQAGKKGFTFEKK